MINLSIHKSFSLLYNVTTSCSFLCILEVPGQLGTLVKFYTIFVFVSVYTCMIRTQLAGGNCFIFYYIYLFTI